MDELKPQVFDEYIGQAKLKARLKIHIDASLTNFRRLDHILLTGPPGCGKSSLARIVADEALVPFVEFIMPIKPMVLRNIVRAHQGIVFFDEIHRMVKKDQEQLLTVLEEGYLATPTGHRIECPLLTIIGATTQPQKIDEAVYDRFPIKPPFEDYTDGQMGEIIRGMAQKVGVNLSKRTAIKLGKATGGIPREGKSLVLIARDTQLTKADAILEVAGLDADGLNDHHRKYLSFVINNGGQSGIEMIVHHLDLPKPVLLDMEKFLVKKGYIVYTPGGREATSAAYAKLKQTN